MNTTINAMPVEWQVFAYTVLGLGTVFVLGFLIEYMVRLPWASSPEGRHLVAMSANVGAFFVLYLVLAVWPEFPGRGIARIGLLVAIVANCGVRWWLLRRHLRTPARQQHEESP